MSITNDLDSDALISHLAGPLSPPARAAFRRVAMEALDRLPCYGEGALYRAIAPLQRGFFSPPDFRRAAWDISQELPRDTKLTNAAPIEYGGDLRHVRYRKRAR
jgi:hypothetical protein